MCRATKDCEAPPDLTVIIGCKHEHVQKWYLCDDCWTRINNAPARACWSCLDQGHICRPQFHKLTRL